jgi:hypothetical protein
LFINVVGLNEKCTIVLFLLSSVLDTISAFPQLFFSTFILDGFGGLVVSILATGTRVRGFKPSPEAVGFSGIRKILSIPSFGGEVK